MKPVVTPKDPKYQKSADFVQAIFDRVPEELWQKSFMDIVLFGDVLESTKEEIEKWLRL